DLRRTGEQPLVDLFRQGQAELLEAQGRLDDATGILIDVWRTYVRDGAYGAVPFLAPDLARLMVATGRTEASDELMASVEVGADRLGSPTARSAALACRGLFAAGLHAPVAAGGMAPPGPPAAAPALAHQD